MRPNVFLSFRQNINMFVHVCKSSDSDNMSIIWNDCHCLSQIIKTSKVWHHRYIHHWLVMHTYLVCERFDKLNLITNYGGSEILGACPLQETDSENKTKKSTYCKGFLKNSLVCHGLNLPPHHMHKTLCCGQKKWVLSNFHKIWYKKKVTKQMWKKWAFIILISV